MDKTLWAAIAVACAACMVAGCATTPIAASSDSLSRLQGQPLTIVTYDPHAGFVQNTYGVATGIGIGGLVGAAVQGGFAGVNSDRVKKNDIVNPSGRVAEQLWGVLINRLKPSTVKPVNDMKDGESESGLATLAAKKGLVFDVQGNALSNYYPLDWTHYRIQYYATARLMDAGTGKIVAQAPCKYESEEKNAPTYDQLYANNASLLKMKLQAAADACAAQIASTMFKA